MLKIVTTINNDLEDSGENYDRVISFYDKEKEVPIMMNFFSEKAAKGLNTIITINLLHVCSWNCAKAFFERASFYLNKGDNLIENRQ